MRGLGSWSWPAIVVDVVDDDGTGGAGVDGVDGEEILVVDVVLGGPVVVVEGFGATVVVVVVAPAAPRLDRVRLQSASTATRPAARRRSRAWRSRVVA